MDGSTRTFKLSLTPDELTQAFVDSHSATPAGRQQLRAARKSGWIALVLAAVIVGGVVIRALRPGGPVGWVPAAFMVCTCAIFAGLVFWYTSPRAVRDRAVKAAGKPMSAELLHEHTVTLSPEGFGFAGRDSTTMTRWRSYEGVVMSGTFLLFPMADARVNVLPVRAVGGIDAAGTLAEQCRVWIAADGGGEQRSVVAYLKAHDTPCPKCQYQLRDLPRAQCPECGTVLGRENLPQAFG